MVFPHMFRTEHSETKTTSGTYGEFYEWKKTVHLKLLPETVDLLKYVDDNRPKYIEDLKEAIAIPSISGDFDFRNEVKNMITFTEKWLKRLKVKFERFDAGWHRLQDVCVKLPEILIGSLRTNRKLKTLVIYGYLDVTSPEGQNWDTDPFELTEKDKHLYGKGVACGKGMLICWFHAIQAYQKNKIPLPVNIKFIIQAMHEQGNNGLEELLRAKKTKLLFDVDNVVIAECEWLATKYPCLIYGCAGRCRFEVTVEQHKNSDHNADMEMIFSNLVNADGQHTIPTLNDPVDHITPSEEVLYDKIHYDFDEIKMTLPPKMQNWDKLQLLMSFWRLPAITIGDVQNCSCDKNDQTKIKRGFTIKIVPKQVPKFVAETVTEYIYNVCKQNNCASKVSIEMIFGAYPWLQDFRTINYVAARNAIVQVYKEEPDMIREDKELPILLLLNRVIEKDILLLPIPNNICNARGANENISLRNFFEGTKVMIAYLKQLSIASSMVEENPDGPSMCMRH